MINVFISAIIAIFFLGKASKDAIEKTKRASWFRTTVYFFLAIIFSIIFYKSHQVATILNLFEFESFRGAEDSLHNSKDTIQSIIIQNDFKTIGSYQNLYLDLLKQNINDNNKNFNNIGGGGITIKLKCANSPSDIIKDRGNFNKYIKYDIEECLNKDISNSGPIYSFRFMSTNIPSFIPIFPIVNCDSNEVASFSTAIRHTENLIDLKDQARIRTSNGECLIVDCDGGEELLRNGLFYEATVVIHDLDSFRVNNTLNIGMAHFIVNTIDFLTAADLSQYTYLLEIHSDMYINDLLVNYNIPIEVTNQADKLYVGLNNIIIGDKYVLNHGGQIAFFVKLPTMANLQQIRVLLLTALVTTFFSLFCANLFYCLRKKAIKYRSTHQLKISDLRRISRKRIKVFRYFQYIISLFFIGFVLIVVCMSTYGRNFKVHFDYLGFKITTLIIGVLAILLVINYFLYNYSVTPIPKKRGKEKLKEKDEKEATHRHERKSIY